MRCRHTSKPFDFEKAKSTEKCCLAGLSLMSCTLPLPLPQLQCYTSVGTEVASSDDLLTATEKSFILSSLASGEWQPCSLAVHASQMSRPQSLTQVCETNARWQPSLATLQATTRLGWASATA